MKLTRLGVALCALIIVFLAMDSSARADSIVVVTPSANQGWVSGDTRPGGTAQIDGAFPRSGDGSLHVATNDAAAKGAFQRDANYGPLSSLTRVGFDWYRNGASTGPNHLAPALQMSGFNSGAQFFTLTWERVYNAGGAAPTDTWNTEDTTNQLFWLRIGGVNFDNVADMKTLAQWQADARVGSNASLVRFLVNVGSGWSGTFDGAADNFVLGFNGENTTYNFEVNGAPVPEPATMILLGSGLVGLGAKLRSRRKAKKL